MARVRLLTDGLSQEKYFEETATGIKFRRMLGALVWPYGELPGCAVVLGETCSRQNIVGMRLPAFIGLHMKGAEEIAETFGVKVDTVRQWQKNGAPIILLGKKWQASYFDLWDWLKDRQAIENEE